MFDPVSLPVFTVVSSATFGCLSVLLFLSPSLWLANSLGWSFTSVLHQLSGEQDLTSANLKPGLVYVLFSCLLLLLGANVLGLLPYSYTATSHMSVVASFSLVLWLSSVVFGVVSAPVMFMSHLVPLGSPLGLAPFMVLIESVSLFIRPITLSVRLMANMVSGHLILSLLSSGLVAVSSLLGGSLAMLSLLGLELAVAIIQGYVFSTLLCLYWSEV